MQQPLKIATTVHDFVVDKSGCPIFTPKEFGELLGVSVQTVNRWDRSGYLVAYRATYNGRVYRYYTQKQYDDFVVSSDYLQLNHVKNSDLIDATIGKLHIVDFSEAARKKGYYGSYICECDCGNVVELARSELLSGKHKSCGCRFHDLTGKDFGRWHVDGIAPCAYTAGGSKLFQYFCTCKCGTKRVVTARSLTSGASKSCGCWHKEVISSLFLNDLTDHRFGNLVVKERADTYWSPSGKSMRSMWLCQCDCGEFVTVSSDNLLSGRIDMCDKCEPKTGASRYELHVRRYLESIGLFDGDGFIQYKTYPDLFGVGGGYLSYDFLACKNGKEWLIECQGEQHYRAVKWYGGDVVFAKQKEHDKRKREYAQQHGIPLIEVPFDVISYDDTVKLLQFSGVV